MIRGLNNERGNALLGALIVMIILAAASAAVVNLSGTDSKLQQANTQSVQALQVGNAGLQWALDKLNWGYSADVTNQAIGNGLFTVVTNPGTSFVTVTATVGDATNVQSMNADFAYNCVSTAVSDADVDDTELTDIQLVKSCNAQAILDKVIVEWDWSGCAQGIGCFDSDPDNLANYTDPSNPDKILICHVPPGNPDGQTTVSTSQDGWETAHNNGTGPAHNLDYLGACNGYSCESYSYIENDLEACTQDTGGALVNQIDFAGTTVFQTGSIPSSDTTSATSGEVIDVQDAILADDAGFVLSIFFTSSIEIGGWYDVTAIFKDGSSVTVTFRAVDQDA